MKAENLDDENLQHFRNIMYVPIDLQRDSQIRVIYVQDSGKSYLYIMTLYISSTKEQMMQYLARIISVLEEKYPSDESIHDWQEIFDGTLTGDVPRKAKTAGTSKLKGFALSRNTVSPEICTCSENSGPNMTFVHTRSTGSEAYYRLADRIRDNISFSVIEQFNLRHIEQATYGIPNIAKRYIEILKRHQPQGPYILGEWCYGGIVAHEMACQLQNADEEVQYLFMLYSHAVTNSVLRWMAQSMYAVSGREHFESFCSTELFRVIHTPHEHDLMMDDP